MTQQTQLLKASLNYYTSLFCKILKYNLLNRFLFVLLDCKRQLIAIKLEHRMEITIDISAGNLKDRIPVSRISGISSLTLNGTLNGDDIEFLRQHLGGYDIVDFRKAGPIESIDLSGCNLVSGGIYKKSEFMGRYRGQMSITRFMELWTSTEIQGPGYGLKLLNADEISDEMFLGCYKFKRIVLPSKIKKIGDLAFYNCDNLTEIYIGDKLESIGEYVFENNFNLKEIHIRVKKPPILSEYAFGNPRYQNLPQTNPRKKISVFVPRGCASDYWLQWGFDNVFEE